MHISSTCKISVSIAEYQYDKDDNFVLYYHHVSVFLTLTNEVLIFNLFIILPVQRSVSSILAILKCNAALTIQQQTILTLSRKAKDLIHKSKSYFVVIIFPKKSFQSLL